MKTILLFFITISCYSQNLHHQMLSSQGASSHLSGGIVVRQTIGQQSTIGNFKKSNLIFGQGFQQNSKIKLGNSAAFVVNTKTYPNPFIDKVNFQFSSPLEGPIKVELYDILGRLIYTVEKFPSNNIITINNLFFPEGEYFAKLTTNNFTYTTNLLKSK